MDDADACREFQRLRTLQATGLLDAPAPAELEEICQRAQARFEVAATLITLVAQETLIIKARAGLDFEDLPRLGQFCDHTIRSDEVLVVADAALDPRFAANPGVTGAPFIRFYAGAPLLYVRDLRLGALCVLDLRPRMFKTKDRAALARLAEEAVGIIMERQFNSVWGSERTGYWPS